jgi:hypothetical protein
MFAFPQFGIQLSIKPPSTTKTVPSEFYGRE